MKKFSWGKDVAENAESADPALGRESIFEIWEARGGERRSFLLLGALKIGGGIIAKEGNAREVL